MKKNCKICGKEFELNSNSQKYCSNECSIVAYKATRKSAQAKYFQSEAYKAYQTKYRQSKSYKDYQKAYQTKYAQTEAGKIANMTKKHKRRALKKQVLHEDYRDWLKELKLHKTFTCHWCWEKFPINKLTLDHVIPLSKGGSDTKDNLVPACAHCNCSKRAKDPEEFNKTLEQPRLI